MIWGPSRSLFLSKTQGHLQIQESFEVALTILFPLIHAILLIDKFSDSNQE